MKSVPLDRDLIKWFFQGGPVEEEIQEPTDYPDETEVIAENQETQSISNIDLIGNLEVDKGLKFLLLPDSVRLQIAKEDNDSADYTEFRLRTLLYEDDGLICDEKFETELKIVISLLSKHQNWAVDINSYTDSRGSSEFNKTLSRNRAEFLKDYFNFYGVKDNQVDVHGYGEQFPINHCVDGVNCSEEEYKRNRRTTMHFKMIPKQ